MSWTPRWRRTLTVVVALLICLTACGTTTDQSSTDAAGEATGVETITERLQGDFATISGNEISLESLQGSDVVLWFWAPW